MAYSMSWSRVAGVAILVLFVFLTLFTTPDLYSKKQLQGDALAVPILGRRHALSLFNSNPNSTDGVVSRAPNLRPIPSASDEVYNRATDKGRLLKCWMKDPSAAGSLGTSKWNDYDALKEWGWIETTTTLYGGERSPGFSDIVGPFGDDDWTNENKVVKFEHKGQHPDQEVTLPDGSRREVGYPPTNAVYENKLYPGRGVIIAEWNWNPQIMIKDEQTSKGRDWDPDTMRQPDLFQMSDFWWLMWKKYTTPTQRPALRAIAKHNIVNEPTQQVIARALKQQWPDEAEPSLGRAPVWPGKVFTPDMEGLAPLLGINSIWGIPWFLIQHYGEGELGRLEVKRITVFVDVVSAVFYQPSAIVEVGPVEDEA
ncbi:hypothetical protein M409DRAFT_25136 [Zasmidium cellare ATCC 36951]|uniref:Uncharacterized protein n=1 Tax=Zasmidium cellare ATCC 36951 TaxID=1080233 RepID=A0A6A6CDE2_ZASCE|nr:uncharacterized protein M409DRAFT_25136 [Zasmidium cellare ATCC 36951]KAF2164743.1 hypothetical protein M409DRAFT_25136 [Zasmidium cellare ATCC 36951]